jgi:glycosyl transferase, family 25
MMEINVKCYVINLDRSPDRMAWMTSQTEPVGIAVKRVPAVDGKLLEERELSRWKSVMSNRFGMGPGEIGCFLAHRRAWEMLISDQQDWGFVAEDDIHFSKDASLLFQNSAWIPADADVVKGETVNQRAWLSRQSVPATEGYRLHQLCSLHGGAAGYFLSQSAAEYLLSATNELCSIPDQVIFNPVLGIAKQLRIYQIVPAICIQDWCLKGTQEKGFESLLLSEREQFHVNQTVRRRRGRAKLFFKLGNLAQKASRAGLMLAANSIGTHTVKKVPFKV